MMDKEAEKIHLFRAALLSIGLEWDRQYVLRSTGATWQLRWIRPVTYAQLTQAENMLKTILTNALG